MASKLWEQVNEVIIGRQKSQKLVAVGGQLSLNLITFHTVAISSDHQPARDLVPDCIVSKVKISHL